MTEQHCLNQHLLILQELKQLYQNLHMAVMKIFSPEEIAYCEKKAKKYQHYAVRFAAKEAVYKALNGKRLILKDISIKNNTSGRPEVILKGKKQKDNNIMISLSHSHRYAVAYAIAVRNDKNRIKRVHK